MHTRHDKVRLFPLLPLSLPSASAALVIILYDFSYGKRSLRIFNQRRCARKSLRVSLLQLEAQRRERRAGHGDTAGAVLGAVDGGGLFACLATFEVESLGFVL